MQATDAAVDECWPLGQSRQVADAVACSVAEYVPAPHAKQTVEPRLGA